MILRATHSTLAQLPTHGARGRRLPREARIFFYSPASGSSQRSSTLVAVTYLLSSSPASSETLVYYLECSCLTSRLCLSGEQECFKASGTSLHIECHPHSCGPLRASWHLCLLAWSRGRPSRATLHP
ncbi:unnamed protein product, partial [Prorocentrum cordatum]